jgi:hypothetical protein
MAADSPGHLTQPHHCLGAGYRRRLSARDEHGVDNGGTKATCVHKKGSIPDGSDQTRSVSAQVRIQLSGSVA